jgi:hypothetical protein
MAHLCSGRVPVIWLLWCTYWHTKVGAGAAAGALLYVYSSDVAGGGQHGHPVMPGLHRAAATGTTVTYCVEAAQHGVFKEGVMHVAAFVLGFKYLFRFALSYPPGTTRVVLSDKTGEGFADDEANV